MSKFGNFFGGGGGRVTHISAGEGQQEDIDDDQNQNVNDDESNDDDSPELNALGKLFEEEEDDDPDDDKNDDSDDKKDKKPAKSQEELLASEIQTMLKGITVKDDDIPDDFDPNDKKQLRDLLNKTHQSAAQATLQIALKPMQLALTSMVESIRSEIQTTVRNAIGGTRAESALSEFVPEVNDPNLGPMVKTLHVQAGKKESDPVKQAKMVRKALDAMGIKGSGGGGGGRQNDSDPSGVAFRSGSAALDLFAPIPKRKAASK